MIIRCEITERKKFEIERGVHHYNSLVIVLDGEFEYTAENETKKVLPFEPVIFKKGTSFVKKVITPIEFIIVSSQRFSFECDTPLNYDEKGKARLKNTVEQLITAINEDLPDTIKEHFVNDIFLTSLKRNISVTENSLRPVYDYINKNFQKKLSLKFLANINCCSVQTLINRFKKQIGKTPIEYINELRIKKAKKLLIDTDFSIGQISELCGFENIYYFSNVFKKETGISPLKFRNGSLL